MDVLGNVIKQCIRVCRVGYIAEWAAVDAKRGWADGGCNQGGNLIVSDRVPVAILCVFYEVLDGGVYLGWRSWGAAWETFPALAVIMTHVGHPIVAVCIEYQRLGAVLNDACVREDVLHQVLSADSVSG